MSYKKLIPGVLLILVAVLIVASVYLSVESNEVITEIKEYQIRDVNIGETIKIGSCAVDITKISTTQNTFRIHYKALNTNNSYLSYLAFFLYNEDGKRYKENRTQTYSGSINEPIESLLFTIDDDFVNSDTIKIEVYQSNVTSVLEVFPFEGEEINFEYEGFQYALKLINQEDNQSNFTLEYKSEGVPVFPMIAMKDKRGWKTAYSQYREDDIDISSFYIPRQLINTNSDNKSNSQTVVDYIQKNYQHSLNVETVQVVLPTLLEKEVFVRFESDGTFGNPIDLTLYSDGIVTEIGLVSPNGIEIITESIEIKNALLK